MFLCRICHRREVKAEGSACPSCRASIAPKGTPGRQTEPENRLPIEPDPCQPVLDRRQSERRKGIRGSGPLGPGATLIHVRLDRSLRQKIEQVAEGSDVEVSVAIRQLIRRGLRIPNL